MFFLNVIIIGVIIDTSRSKIIKINITDVSFIFVGFFLFFILLNPHSLVYIDLGFLFVFFIFEIIIIIIIINIIIIFIDLIIILFYFLIGN